jgi:hypothetical protein
MLVPCLMPFQFFITVYSLRDYMVDLRARLGARVCVYCVTTEVKKATPALC